MQRKVLWNLLPREKRSVGVFPADLLFSGVMILLCGPAFVMIILS